MLGTLKRQSAAKTMRIVSSTTTRERHPGCQDIVCSVRRRTEAAEMTARHRQGGPQVTVQQFWAKLQPQQRFNEESSDVAKAGFSSLRYNGAVVAVDQYAPSGTLWGLNMKKENFQLYVSALEKYQFGSKRKAPSKKAKVIQFPGNNSVGLPKAA